MDMAVWMSAIYSNTNFINIFFYIIYQIKFLFIKKKKKFMSYRDFTGLSDNIIKGK